MLLTIGYGRCMVSNSKLHIVVHGTMILIKFVIMNATQELYRSVVRDVNYLCILLGLTVLSINPAVASLLHTSIASVGGG